MRRRSETSYSIMEASKNTSYLRFSRMRITSMAPDREAPAGLCDEEPSTQPADTHLSEVHVGNHPPGQQSCVSTLYFTLPEDSNARLPAWLYDFCRHLSYDASKLIVYETDKDGDLDPPRNLLPSVLTGMGGIEPGRKVYQPELKPSYVVNIRQHLQEQPARHWFCNSFRTRLPAMADAAAYAALYIPFGAVPDRPRSNLHIHHSMETTLDSVGLQVWKGALLLCDVIVALGSALHGINALELGTGTGVAGLCTAAWAKTTFLTDIETVIENCMMNVAVNYPNDWCNKIRVRSLDWNVSLERQLPRFNVKGPHPMFRYAWGIEDIYELASVQLLLAADVIYDPETTESFLKCAAGLMRHIRSCNDIQPVLLLSLEKRFNFTLDDLDVRAPMYDHFLSLITREDGQGTLIYPKGEQENAPGLIGRQLSIEGLPQATEYERGTDLELWMLQVEAYDCE